MSIEPGNKPSLLAAFADEYELEDADADRLIARIQTSVAQDAAAGSSSPSPSVNAARGSGVGKSLLLIGASCVALATASAVVLYPPSKTDPVAVKVHERPIRSGATERAAASRSGEHHRHPFDHG